MVMLSSRAHLLYQQDAGGTRQQQGQEAGQALEAPVQDSALEPGPTQESGDALHMALCMAPSPAQLQHMLGIPNMHLLSFLWYALQAHLQVHLACMAAQQLCPAGRTMGRPKCSMFAATCNPSGTTEHSVSTTWQVAVSRARGLP